MIRFTETDKWKDSWFRKLKPSEKLLWIYILDNCDNAGFFEYDLEYCCFMTGMTEQQVEGAIKGLSRGLVGAKTDELFFVKNFLKHQRNDVLNPENNAHKQIIKLMSDNQPKFTKKLGANKGLKSPIGKVKVDVKVEYTEEFERFWKVYPKKKGKGAAFKVFQKTTNKPELEVLIKAVESEKQTEDWTKESGKFIPKPQNWLADRRWDDEVTEGAFVPFHQNGKSWDGIPLCDGLTREQFIEKFGRVS